MVLVSLGLKSRQQIGDIGVIFISGTLGFETSQMNESIGIFTGICWNWRMPYATASFFPSGGCQDMSTALLLNEVIGSLKTVTILAENWPLSSASETPDAGKYWPYMSMDIFWRKLCSNGSLSIFTAFRYFSSLSAFLM